jgi:hypothetical protein
MANELDLTVDHIARMARRVRMNVSDMTAVPLVRDCAVRSACSAHTVTGKKVVTPSAHSPDSRRRRELTATVNQATGRQVLQLGGGGEVAGDLDRGGHGGPPGGSRCWCDALSLSTARRGPDSRTGGGCRLVDDAEFTRWKDEAMTRAQERGEVEAGLVPAGQVAGSIQSTVDVAEHLDEMVADALVCLNRRESPP